MDTEQNINIPTRQQNFHNSVKGKVKSNEERHHPIWLRIRRKPEFSK